MFGFQSSAVGANAHASRFWACHQLRDAGHRDVVRALLTGGRAVAGRRRTGYVIAGYVAGLRLHRRGRRHAGRPASAGVILASIFVAGMLVGADSMSRAIAVPNYIADVIVATRCFCHAGRDAIRAVPPASQPGLRNTPWNGWIH